MPIDSRVSFSWLVNALGSRSESAAWPWADFVLPTALVADLAGPFAPAFFPEVILGCTISAVAGQRPTVNITARSRGGCLVKILTADNQSSNGFVIINNTSGTAGLAGNCTEVRNSRDQGTAVGTYGASATNYQDAALPLIGGAGTDLVANIGPFWLQCGYTLVVQWETVASAARFASLVRDLPLIDVPG